MTDLFQQGPAHQPGMPWDAQARLLIRSLPVGWQGTGENIRVWLLHAGLPQPPKPNAWGQLIRDCIKRGLIKATGIRVPMTGPKAHGRMTDVYIR